jgi:hypothetical protein
MDKGKFGIPKYIDSGSSSSGASSSTGGSSELYQKVMRDLQNPSASSAPEQSTSGASPPVSTERPQLEGSMPASEYADMPIGQVLGKAVTNIPRSGVNTLKQLGEAVFVNPGDTLSAIGDVGKGLASKAAGAVGFEQDPTKKAETERVVDAIGGMYKDRYTNYGEFAKTLAEDPFAIGMDVATVVPGIGLVSKAPLAGKIAKVASFGDPLAIATKAVSAAPQFVAGALRIPQALATGSPAAALNIGQQLGRTGDKIERNAFLRGTRKDVPLSTVSDQAVDLVQELKKNVQSSYLRGRSSLATQELPMGDILAALNKAESSLGLNTYAFPEVRAVLDSMRKQIDESYTHPNPAARSAVELDTLKQSLNDIIRLNSKNIGGKIGLVGEVARSVRDTIARADPSYAKMMEDYQQWIEHFKDLKAIGANEGLSETARIQKLLTLLKKEDRLDLLTKLSEGTTAGKELIPMLAGMAFREIAPPAYQGFGLAGLGMLAAQGPHGIGAAALGSPKLAGLSQYALGRIGGAVPQISSAIPNALVNLEGQRTERKSGGRVDSHEAEADRLVMAAERAKKGLSAHTEGLLNTSDDAVASALEIANRSI